MPLAIGSNIIKTETFCHHLSSPGILTNVTLVRSLSEVCQDCEILIPCGNFLNGPPVKVLLRATTFHLMLLTVVMVVFTPAKDSLNLQPSAVIMTMKEAMMKRNLRLLSQEVLQCLLSPL